MVSYKRKYVFDILPSELKIKIYKYDNTYRNIFNLVLKELIHFYIKKNIKKISYPHSFIIIFI